MNKLNLNEGRIGMLVITLMCEESIWREMHNVFRVWEISGHSDLWLFNSYFNNMWKF